MMPAMTPVAQMTLAELLSDLDVPQAPADVVVFGIKLDSREIEPGYVFVALAGTRSHGLSFCTQALQHGAIAVLYDPSSGGQSIADEFNDQIDIVFIAIDELDQKLGQIASRFYQHPSRQLNIIGITGTDGKTSCSHFLSRALNGSQRCAVIGTLGWGFPDDLQFSQHTTPDAIELQYRLSALHQRNAEVVSMEVSSHALAQGRVNAVQFNGAVFTNISRDHLDYHGTFDDYLKAKLQLLKAPGLKFAVINLDDGSAKKVINSVPVRVAIFGYSRKSDNNTIGFSNINILSAKGISHSAFGLQLTVQYQGADFRLIIPVMGDFNVDNVLATMGCLIAMGYSAHQASAMLPQIKAVPGRLERFTLAPGGPTVIVDYAHTPQALEKALLTIKSHCQGRVWLVFGCGGDRDRGKRPEMGRIAEKLADRVVVTDDNPRSENGEAIILDILEGCVNRYISVVCDRRKAIECAVSSASPNDTILIAGKGHENYQEIDGKKYPFSDRQVIAEMTLQKDRGEWQR